MIGCSVVDDAQPARYRRRECTLWRGVIGGVLVKPSGSRESWFITSPGDVVWDLLAEALTLDQLAETLSRDFGEPVETIRPDIAAAIDALVEIAAVLPLA